MKETFIMACSKYLGTKEGDIKHKDIVNNYNRQSPLPRGYRLKVTDAWCAGFLTAVAVECGCVDIFPCECSVFYMRVKAIDKGYTINKKDLEIGDFIIYDWKNDGTVDHVGIVVSRDGNKLKVLEGNKNDMVGYRTIGVNSKNIVYCFRIPWAEEVVSQLKDLETLAREVILGKWGNGGERRLRLREAGYDYNKVQAKVNAMLKTGSPTGKSVDEVAREVIKGLWGNGAARIQKLRRSGYDYTVIQRRVNEILKSGK